jgi:transposase-like protein
MSVTIDLTDPIFHDEQAARAYFEAQRWPTGPYCPHCGSVEVIRMMGAKHRTGAFNCRGCRKAFSATVGTVFESSKVPLHKWMLANHLMNASKKGVSAHQLHRMIHVTYKTAWFMEHRLREAMTTPNAPPLGGEGKIVEADEAYHGKRETQVPRSRNATKKFTKRGLGGGAQKRPIFALVERRGKAHAVHMPHVTGKNIRAVLVRHADRKSRLHTDESNLYPRVGTEFTKHESVNHSKKEYARGDVTTNTVEGFFSVFKRGMIGVYQHCGEQHFQRYLDEFTFRFNAGIALGMNDTDRANLALLATVGKRLTYRRISKA